MSTTAAAWPTTPGKARGLARVLSADGFVLNVALDHVDEFRELLPRQDFASTVRAKVDLVRAVAPVVSSVLVDAHYGVGYLAPTGAVPRDVGMLVSLEEGDYSDTAPRSTHYLAGWDVERARRAGVDAVKLLWWYRPDGDPDLAAAQRATLAALGERCAAADVLLVVEPIWFPRPGEDTRDRAWQIARAAGIAASAATAEELGADVLKVQFPADLDLPGGERLARDALAAIDAALARPWVVLSAGVPFETFAHQLELACGAGASGYIAGRSLWREVVSAACADARAEAVDGMLERLAVLNEVTRRHGRPVAAPGDLGAVLTALPEGWYAG